MSKAKRTKNIFNRQIDNQSLFHWQQQTKFKIGDKQISSNWLDSLSHEQYITNIYSSLKLSELKQELQKLRDQASHQMMQANSQFSSPLKANMFKIVVLKKKILNFQIDNSGDYKKIKQLAQQSKQFQISKPPSTQNMLIQKVSGIFNSSYQRKCTINQKVLIIESKKNQTNKNQWPQINLEQCQMQIQTKLKPLYREQFKHFIWKDGYQTRILLKKQNSRPYCLYASQQQIQMLLKYLKFYNFQKTLQKNKQQVFKSLSNQLFQKVITLFGNKLRLYDHKIKMKNSQRELNSHQLAQSPKKYFSINQLSKPDEKILRVLPKYSENDKSLGNQSNGIKQSIIKKKSQNDKSQIIFSPDIRKRNNSHIASVSTFKLRSKKATVFYDELGGDLRSQQFEQSQKRIIQSPIYSIRDPYMSPEYKIDDFNLNITQQIGMSEIDQNQSSRQFSKNRQRTTNFYVSSGNPFNPNHQTNQEQNNEVNKFNINIHEIMSDSQNEYQQNQDSQSNNSPYDSSYFNLSSKNDRRNINLFNLNKNKKDDSSSISSLDLQGFQQNQNFSLNPNQNQQNYHSSSLTSSRKSNHIIKLCFRERQLKYHVACYGIELMYPYHKSQINFMIIQIDPEIEMQKYKVICSQKFFKFNQKKISDTKYTYFTHQNEQNLKFKLNKQSNNFIFILKQTTSNQEYHYPFQIDLNSIKYQRDMSQLIFIKHQILQKIKNNVKISQKGSSFADKKSFQSKQKQVYKFGAILKLYISPQPVQIWHQYTTKQFINKYIQMSMHENYYNFKHNFIQKKKVYHELKTQLNKKIIRNLLKQATLQQKYFNKLMFHGIPSQIIRLLQQKLSKQQNIHQQQIWKMINFVSELKHKQLKLYQDSIISSHLFGLKMIVRPLEIVKTLSNLQIFNRNLKKRLYQVALFLLNKNPFSHIIQNLMTAFGKQVLNILQNIIINLKFQSDILTVIKIYLEIEYQIDQLFAQIQKYFENQIL